MGGLCKSTSPVHSVSTAVVPATTASPAAGKWRYYPCTIRRGHLVSSPVTLVGCMEAVGGFVYYLPWVARMAVGAQVGCGELGDGSGTCVRPTRFRRVPKTSGNMSNTAPRGQARRHCWESACAGGVAHSHRSWAVKYCDYCAKPVCQRTWGADKGVPTHLSAGAGAN